MQSRVLIVLIAVLVAVSAFAAPPEKINKPALVGTWVTTVAPPPEAEVPPFTLIFSFMSDHNLIATGTGGQFPALGNPCQGTWTSTDEGAFAITYLCLDFDSNFAVTGMDKVTAQLTANDKTKTLSGLIALTNYDPAGQEVFSACCATVDGTRLEVEPLLPLSGSTWKPAPRLRR